MDLPIDEDFSGVIHVARGDEVVHSSAHGFSRRSDQVRNTLDTRFAQASGAKTFVATATARLVEEGHFKFENHMSAVLDLWPEGFDDSVTVHHLLTHTSGIPDYFDEEFEDDYEALWTDLPVYRMQGPSDLLPLFVDKPMKFRPGQQFSYSNASFVVLGLLIEQHTAVPFDQFVSTQVFDVAGMEDAGFFPLDRMPARTALNYMTAKDPQNPRTNIYAVPAYGQPDGGSYATVADMTKFWAALHNRELLAPAITDTVLTRHAETRNGGYGYGLWIDDDWGRNRIHHAEGGDDGANFLSGVGFEDEVVATVCSNTDGGVDDIYQSIFTQLLKEAG